MARGKLTPAELLALHNNPYVIDANETRIIYSNEFKFHFMQEYNKGLKPTQIFADSGFDIHALGDKRIERAASRWKQSYSSGTLGAYDDPQVRKETAEKNKKCKKNAVNRTVRSQRTLIKNLELQIEHKDAKLSKQTARSQEILKHTISQHQEKLQKQEQTIAELKAQVELLKKAGSLGRRRCAGKVFGKTDLCELVKNTIEKFSLQNSVKALCAAVGLARSTYYYYLKSAATRTAAAFKDNNLFSIIKTAFNNCPFYKKGSRSIKMMLSNDFEYFINRKTIQRIMRKYNLVCPIRSCNPYKKLWKATVEDRIAPNLLKRQFKTGTPRKVLLTDITYLKHQGAFSYLSVILDAETKEPLSYVLSKNLKVGFVLKTLDKLKDTKFPEGALIHSDQGVHYTCKAFRQKVAGMNLTQSMSRRGNCLDNAACESFFGHMKQELPDYKDYSFDELCKLIDRYMHYYRYERYQDNLHSLTPYDYSRTLAA